MPRSQKLAVLTPPPAQAPPAALRSIDPRHVGTLPEWGGFLGLPRHCLKREARLGRLKVYKRAGKLWTTGAAVVDWLHRGEVKRPVATNTDHGRPD
jgi:hypothetical protein